MRRRHDRDGRPRRWLVRAGTGLILPGVLGGCASGPARDCDHGGACPTVPKGAIPPPYGTHTNEVLNGQARRAEPEDFIVPRNEWYLGGNEPGPDGRRRLAMLADRAAAEPFPIVVEEIEPEDQKVVSATATAATNEARRRYVVEYLGARGIVDADARVVVGRPTAEGLYGVTAAEIGNQYLRGQGGGGSNGNFNGGFGGGFGGGAGGFGGVGGGLGTAGGAGGLGGGLGGFN